MNGPCQASRQVDRRSPRAYTDGTRHSQERQDLRRMKLAWNAWSLARESATPFALHLLELIETLRGLEDGPSTVLVVPEPLAAGPSDLENKVVTTPPGAWGRLRFEQGGLPRAAERTGADLILCPEPLAPLRSPVPLAVAGSQLAPASAGSVTERLRRAVGHAGAGGAALYFRWADEVAGESGQWGRLMAPFVSSGFRPTDPGDDRARRRGMGLPQAYVLCHGAEPIDLELLLAAWTWVEASIGPAVPLVFVGLPPAAAAALEQRAEELDIRESVQSIGRPQWADLPALYRGAEAMLHPGHSRSGQEWRWALASGLPLAGVETARSAAVLGPAAYLVGDGDARALGAACLTLLVEKRGMGKELREKGLIRAGAYHERQAAEGFWRALRRAAESKR